MLPNEDQKKFLLDLLERVNYDEFDFDVFDEDRDEWLNKCTTLFKVGNVDRDKTLHHYLNVIVKKFGMSMKGWGPHHIYHGCFPVKKDRLPHFLK